MMASEIKLKRKKVTPQEIRSRKCGGEKITLVTAYDYPFSKWADESGIDFIFVSDALSTVGLGRDNVYTVSIEEMVYHTKAVKRGINDSLLLVAMPFLSYSSKESALASAKVLIKEGGAAALEIEGGKETSVIIKALVNEGIPVVGHVGLTKKTAFSAGEYRIQGKNAEDIERIINDAIAVAAAGAFAIILECIPDRVAGIISEAIDIPTISFGAGPHCDGQALVTQDMLGMFDEFCPKFVRRYAEVGSLVRESFTLYREEVTGLAFPAQKHSINISDSELSIVAEAMGESIKPATKGKKGGNGTKQKYCDEDAYVKVIANAIRRRLETEKGEHLSI
jgi:3-methyl-2-oxobutanoate hydroxymethyltransferase